MAAALRSRFFGRSRGNDDDGGVAHEGADESASGDSVGDAVIAKEQAAVDDPAGGDAVGGEAVGGEVADGGAANDEEREWLAYELHPWALEARVMLEQLLTADGVVHSWQGTTLLVHHSLEETVDNLVNEVTEATDREFGPDDDLTAFEVGEWSEEMIDALVAGLETAGVPCVLDQGEDGAEVLVREADEQRAELVIDDLLAREMEADFVELDGLEVNDLMSRMFVACDRLRRSPTDATGVLEAVDAARELSVVRTPFGFSASGWRNLRETAGALLALIEGDDADDDDIRNLAQELRDNLQKLI